VLARMLRDAVRSEEAQLSLARFGKGKGDSAF
jgi:hypothetical protein